MNTYEHLRIEFLLTKTLMEYQQARDGAVNDDDEEIQRKMEEMNRARKLVDEMLSKAKLKELAISKAEESAEKVGSRGPAGLRPSTTRSRSTFRANEMNPADDGNQREIENLKQIKAQVEAIEEKYELGREVMKKLIQSGPGLSDIIEGKVFATDANEEMEEDEEAVNSETMRSLRVMNIHRLNVQKANLLIRCYAHLPYSVEPHFSSSEMKRIGGVIEAVLNGTYEVNPDF